MIRGCHAHGRAHPRPVRRDRPSVHEVCVCRSAPLARANDRTRCPTMRCDSVAGDSEPIAWMVGVGCARGHGGPRILIGCQNHPQYLNLVRVRSPFRSSETRGSGHAVFVRWLFGSCRGCAVNSGVFLGRVEDMRSRRPPQPGDASVSFLAGYTMAPEACRTTGRRRQRRGAADWMDDQMLISGRCRHLTIDYDSRIILNVLPTHKDVCELADVRIEDHRLSFRGQRPYFLHGFGPDGSFGRTAGDPCRRRNASMMRCVVQLDPGGRHRFFFCWEASGRRRYHMPPEEQRRLRRQRWRARSGVRHRDAGTRLPITCIKSGSTVRKWPRRSSAPCCWSW